MNVQDRLIALHDLDAPWRPGDLEQRSGRIIRQGNMNPEVHIYAAYVAKRVPLSILKLSTALTSPIVPMDTRSSLSGDAE